MRGTKALEGEIFKEALEHGVSVASGAACGWVTRRSQGTFGAFICSGPVELKTLRRNWSVHVKLCSEHGRQNAWVER